MAENAMSSPTSVPLNQSSLSKIPEIPVKCVEDDEKIERLEQRIREAEEAKAKRKMKRKAQKGSLKASIDDESSHTRSSFEDQRNHIPIKLSKSSSSPKVSTQSSIPKNDDFATTMARLRAAEKARQEKD
ncbi:putative pre-mrna-splicing factor cwc23 [Erysiphe neolycopersici]|uniref:Putative pre-mrna-splicing factor cwc23 n=1 Tax=Erysiphe neolycopersici TaxID=212602 RepID=A0A420HLY1_9PEZI|nr:putative pre-mrna-splicing factor cwc23 [Erysiphe neolycopersici]